MLLNKPASRASLIPQSCMGAPRACVGHIVSCWLLALLAPTYPICCLNSLACRVCLGSIRLLAFARFHFLTCGLASLVVGGGLSLSFFTSFFGSFATLPTSFFFSFVGLADFFCFFFVGRIEKQRGGGGGEGGEWSFFFFRPFTINWSSLPTR